MLTLQDKINRLNRIGMALTSTTNLEQLFEMIVSESRNFTNADAGSLFTLEEGKLIFRVAQTESLEKKLGHKPPFKAFPLPLSKKSVAGYVALTGETIDVVDCYELDPEKGPSVDRSYDQKMGYRSKSMLTLPMRDPKGEVIGVIQLINAMDEEGGIVSFSADTVDLMLSIASQAAVALKNAQFIAEIKNLFAAFVKYSATAIDERSPHTAGHSRRVAGMAMRLAKAVNEEKEGEFAEVEFSDQELEELWFAAWLHDIGKIAVKEEVLEKSCRLPPDRLKLIVSRLHYLLRSKEIDLLKDTNCEENIVNIERYMEEKNKIDSDIEFLEKLNKSGFLPDDDEARLMEIAASTFKNYNGDFERLMDDFELANLSIKRGNLTQAEWEEMRSHVVKTRNIIKNIPFTKELSHVAEYAAGHHEMLNGTGYPQRLKADQLPLQARILAVADVFDALTAADRPYKPAIPLEKSINILREETDRGRLDGRVVNLLVEKQLFKNHKDDQAEYPWKLEVF